MNYYSHESDIAYANWFYDCPLDEFNTYVGIGEHTLQACPFVKAVFLDLIDHSEAE